MASLGNSTKHTKRNLYQSFSNSSKREKRREDSQSRCMKPPSPLQTPDKVEVSVTQQHSTLCDPMDCSPPGALSKGFPRQEYWSGWPFPSPGDLPNPGIKLKSSTVQADTGSHEPSGKSTPDKGTTKNENYRPVSLMNVDAKITTKYQQTESNNTYT